YSTCKSGLVGRSDALYYGQGIGGGIFDHSQRDGEGNSLLAITAIAGSLHLVRTYLQKGMDINAVNHKGETALHLAMSRRHLEVVDFLVTQPNLQLGEGLEGKSLLHEAASLGLHYLTAQLVHRLDVNGVDPVNGWSPLHYACHNGHEELARLLTSHSNILVDRAGRGGLTALHLAAAAASEKCVSNLLENQANPGIRDEKGQVPAVTAMLHGNGTAANLILE
ncbi:unnamed protein product, partial [Choristocarpus tenellus]